MTTTNPKTLDFVLYFFRLNVKDLLRVSSFYEKAFGFVLESTEKHAQFEERLLVLPEQSIKVALVTLSDNPKPDSGTTHTLGFFTTNVAAATANVVANGGTIEKGPISFPGATIVWVNDPEGNPIEMMHLDGTEVALPDEI